MVKSKIGKIFSAEELEEVVGGSDVVGVELTPEETTPEAIEENSTDIESEIKDIKESTDSANALQDQVEVVEEAGDNVTPVQLEELKLRFIKASLITGIKPGKTKGKLSIEELNGIDISNISTEGIKEFVMDIIEKIKAWLKAFWIKIKKWYLQLVIDMSKDAEKAAELEKQIGTLIASNPVIKNANDIDIAKGMFLASEKDGNTLFKKVAAMEKLTEGKVDTISGLYKDFLNVDHIPYIKVEEKDFEGFNSVKIVCSEDSFNGAGTGYTEKLNKGITPELHKPSNPDSSNIVFFAPVENRLSAITFDMTEDGSIVDIHYGKHHFTGLSGGEVVKSNYKYMGSNTTWDENYRVIRVFGSGSISILTNIVKESTKRTKEVYESYKKEEDITSKILSDLEKQAKDNPEDKEVSRKLKELRKIAMIQSEVMVDNFLAFRAASKDMLYILGLGVKSAEKLAKESKK